MNYKHLFLITAIFLTFGTIQSEEKNVLLAAERSKLQLKLLQERKRILNENPDAARIHRKILDLYKELDAIVNADPRVKNLNKKRKTIEEKINKTK